ncbi:D-alanyl-D-alanine carboxypeptidase family protein [Anabaena cylindrica UHCC 0172]|uniref:D-alanyl-D-alanine carboxypeptidase family protein n=1 Tax=Anabaena cylindrica TaxID=1165 RepID=UPI002B1F4C9C|nr:D-alanyl-D-alanine carboxypeptidase family protein [Anabaena cylindrica]MEA5553073.1 D-alanyl-D-alanine carboxypeptidase family protein [Anabaena cylindrica UHCC 0172]
MKRHSRINRRLRKITFIIFIIFIFFTLVASSDTNYYQSLQNTALTSNVNITPSTSTPFIPSQQLNEQERFLATITHQLVNIPKYNTYEYTILRAYGAVFINQEPEIKLPEKVILDDEQETQYFQGNTRVALVEGTRDCYLQKSAADAFNKARILVNIPLKSGYSGDCTRSFVTNLRFWQKYANSGTLEKVKQGKETKILDTVAPPGTSQHLWGLAIDLRVSSPVQRQALNRNGWFQTVANDIPHWTYLRWSEEDLPKFGLRAKTIRGITYWVTPI